MKKNTPGRPSKFIPELHIKIAEAYAMAGLTNEQIARECGVSWSGFKKWLDKYPELVAAIKEAKELPDEKVEASLFQRAKGYSVKATKIFCSKDGLVTKVPYIEHYPPDPTSMIFWLKNRRPDKWRDKREHELTGKDGGAIAVNYVKDFEGI